MMTNSVQQHPASVDLYIRHGWKLVPIPMGTKGPSTKGWNKIENTLKSQSDLPHGWGIGLAHAYSGTMALDIDDWFSATLALAEHGIDLQSLYDDVDAVTIDSGCSGRGKLLYKMPDGLSLPSKKVIINKSVAYELRCSTLNNLTVQDVLPPSIHPDTKQPYRWSGRGSWLDMPILPDSLLKLWQGFVDQDSIRSIGSETEVKSSWLEIKTALESIDPDCTRDEWLNVGMALHWAGNQTQSGDYALQVWNDWSAQAETKYKGTNDIWSVWKSFKADNGVTLGTFYHIAKTHGWERPPITADELFKDINNDTKYDLLSPIDLINGFKLPPPKLDLDPWPELLATRAREVSEQIGSDPIIPLFAGLSSICGVVDARIRLELMPGFKVPPILWLMTIGAPADKKTPSSKPMMDILKVIQMEDHSRYRDELLKWEGQEAAYVTQKKTFLEWAASGTAMLENDNAPPVPELPNQPVPLKITVADITSQSLIRNAADRPRGLLCYLDEMNTWMKKINDTRSGEDRSSWTVSYESNPYQMDRVGAGSIYCQNLAVSFYGNVQPKIFRNAVKMLGEDGTLQRFIPGIINQKASKLGNPVPSMFTHEEQWNNTVRTVFALPPMDYQMSPGAYESFRDFQRWYEDRKQEEYMIQSSDNYMTAFGKLEGTTGRMILIFHLIDDPFNPFVQKSTVDNVIKIVKGFIIACFKHAYTEIVDRHNESFGVWLIDHIIYMSEFHSTITLSEIRKSARRKFKEGQTTWQKDQIIIDTVYNLEDAKWMIRTEERHNDGFIRWTINPMISSTYKDYRLKVKRAKQKNLEFIYKDAITEKDRKIKGYEELEK